MAQTIADCIPEIADVVVKTSGIKGSGALPSENQNEYPFAMTYLLDGEVGNDVTEGMVDLHNIAIDLLVPRIWDLGDSLTALLPILDTLKNNLFKEVTTVGGGAFNSTIDTFQDLRIFFLPEYPYSSIDLIGYRIIMEQVKLVGIIS